MVAKAATDSSSSEVVAVSNCSLTFLRLFINSSVAIYSRALQSAYQLQKEQAFTVRNGDDIAKILETRAPWTIQEV